MTELSEWEYIAIALTGILLYAMFKGWGLVLTFIIVLIGIYWKKHWGTENHMFKWKKK